MYESIWDWLGIEPTSDQSEIKKAYAQMAKIYHPSEHPDEFRMLRDSYKRAMQMAKGDSGNRSYVRASEYNEAKTQKNQVTEPPKQEAPYEFGNLSSGEKKQEEKYDFGSLSSGDEEKKRKYEFGSLSSGDEKQKEKYEFGGFSYGDQERKEEYDFDDPDSEDFEEEYDFEEPDAEEPEDEYNFDVFGQTDYDFSDRQRAMYVFYLYSLENIRLHPREYSCASSFEVFFEPWVRKPYAAELTPDFVSVLLDRLGEAGLFHLSFYRVMEKVIFAGKCGEEWTRLKAKFAVIKSEAELIKWNRGYSPDKKTVLRMLLGSVEEDKLIKIGFIFEEGLGKNLMKQRFYLGNGLLVPANRPRRYYYLANLTGILKPGSDDLVIRDVNGKKVTRIVSSHPFYSYILKQLRDNGALIIGATEEEIATLAQKFSLDRTLFHHVFFDNRFNRPYLTSSRRMFGFALVTVFQIILAVVGTGFVDASDDSPGAWLFWVIINILNIGTAWVPGILLLFAIVVWLLNTVKILVNIVDYHKIQKECKAGSGMYSFGNRCFVFDKYLVFPFDYECIQRKFITELEVVKKVTQTGDGFFRITNNNGVIKEYFVGDYASAMALYREYLRVFANDVKDITDNARGLSVPEIKEEILKSRYDYLRGKKHLFKRKLLVHPSVRNVYDTNLIIIVVAIAYAGVCLLDQLFLHINTMVEDTIYEMSILAVLLVLMILKMGAAMSFRKIDDELLLDACIQFNYANVYSNRVYKINLLKDYFVSTRFGKLDIIPYKDIEWYSIDHVEKKGNVLLIKEFGKEPKMFCKDKDSNTNAEQVKQIFDFLRNMHPEINVMEESAV